MVTIKTSEIPNVIDVLTNFTSLWDDNPDFPEPLEDIWVMNGEEYSVLRELVFEFINWNSRPGSGDAVLEELIIEMRDYIQVQ